MKIASLLDGVGTPTKCILLLFAVGIATSVGFAQTVVLNFEALATPGIGFTETFASYTDQGFTLSADYYWGPDNHAPFTFYRSDDPRFPGSTALFDNANDAVIGLGRNDGGFFDLLSIDLCALEYGSGNLTFLGYRGSKPVATNSVVYPAGFVLQQFSFDNLTNLTQVRWQQTTPGHQFDNIVLIAKGGLAPAPAFEQNEPRELTSNFPLHLTHLRLGTNYTILKSTDLKTWEIARTFHATLNAMSFEWVYADWVDSPPAVPVTTCAFYRLTW